ncbi:MAG: SEC-C metal-binding domain-containing protein [Candidatus Omnitrophota bacterium]
MNSLSEDTPDELSNYWVHYINNALRAKSSLFKCDKDYIVKDGKVIIVDEFTGRLMPGRRWSEGIHQAIEAKEKLNIQQESQTLATVTLQNYFRMYKKLAGMTGTAYTEASELRHIYKLDVTSIPTNKPLMRTSFSDRIYKTKKGKFKAIIAEIEEFHGKKQPVLVGTSSIDDSEEVSFLLQKKGINHNVLNAKYHEREAFIVAQAGRLFQVTIATNMAGRGTDIVLGGNIDYFIKEVLSRNKILHATPEYDREYRRIYDQYQDKFLKEHEQVVKLGGLHIIGAQRHEARRIDNQLKGRSGRQGDPGSARFYISLEDDLMRLFGSDRIYLLMDRLGFPEDDPIEHPLVTHSIAVAQKRVEAHNFEIRKNLLKFDDVMNRQRETIYNQRRDVLKKESVKDDISERIDEVIAKKIDSYCLDENNLSSLVHSFKMSFDIDLNERELEGIDPKEMAALLKIKAEEFYNEKEKSAGEFPMRMMEKMIFLSLIDARWKEHLLVMDSLKEGIYLRGYAQVDPLVEYQKEAYFAFSEMIDSISASVVELVFKTKMLPSKEIKTVLSHTPKNFVHSQYSSLNQEKEVVEKKEPLVLDAAEKVGRNAPCPCGSGRKYKKCCGR